MNPKNYPLSILLVDDDKTIVEIFKYGLSNHGYEIHTAYSVAEAMKVANTIKIDCLLSDIQLPDKDGITLNGMIKEIYPDVISILMTGYPGISTAVKGLQENIHDYLIKPFSVEQVIASIERALNNNALKKANIHHQETIQRLESEIEELKKRLESKASEKVDDELTRIKKPVDHAHAHKSYLEQQGRLKQ